MEYPREAKSTILTSEDFPVRQTQVCDLTLLFLSRCSCGLSFLICKLGALVLLLLGCHQDSVGQ